MVAQKRIFIKRVIGVILAAAMLFSLAGCGSRKNGAKSLGELGTGIWESWAERDVKKFRSYIWMGNYIKEDVAEAFENFPESIAKGTKIRGVDTRVEYTFSDDELPALRRAVWEYLYRRTDDASALGKAIQNADIAEALNLIAQVHYYEEDGLDGLQMDWVSLVVIRVGDDWYAVMHDSNDPIFDNVAY